MIDGVARIKNLIMENNGVGVTAYFLDKEAVDIAIEGLLELGFDPIPLSNNDWVFSPLNNEEYALAIRKLKALGFEPIKAFDPEALINAKMHDDIFIFSM